jgi:hypothetical protein
MGCYYFIVINEWLIYFLSLRVRVSSHTRGDCHLRALFLFGSGCDNDKDDDDDYVMMMIMMKITIM